MSSLSISAQEERRGVAAGPTEGCSLCVHSQDFLGMRSSLPVRASDYQYPSCNQCNGPGFDPSIRRHSGICVAADEAVLNKYEKN
jgi:hypothetical protein